MAVNHSKKMEALKHREDVAKKYLRGMSMRQIAFEMEIPLTTVFRYLKQTKEEWKQSAFASMSEHKAKELARIDNLEMQAWNAFMLSQGDVLITTDRGRGKTSAAGSTPGATEVVKQTVKKRSAGDARFLKVIIECVKQRCIILGLQVATQPISAEYGKVIGIEVSLPSEAPPEPDLEKEEVADNGGS